jgi:hypothetical protein
MVDIRSRVGRKHAVPLASLLDSLTARPPRRHRRCSRPVLVTRQPSIAFFANGKLKRVNVAGGGLRLAETDGLGGGTWGRTSSLCRLPLAAKPVGPCARWRRGEQSVIRLDPAHAETNHVWPHFLPDGRHFLFNIIGRDNAGLRWLLTLPTTQFSRVQPRIRTTSGLDAGVRHRVTALRARPDLDGAARLAPIQTSRVPPCRLRRVWKSRAGVRGFPCPIRVLAFGPARVQPVSSMARARRRGARTTRVPRRLPERSAFAGRATDRGQPSRPRQAVRHLGPT